MKPWIEFMTQNIAAGRAKYEAEVAALEAKRLEEFTHGLTPVVDRLRRFIATVPESERIPRHITWFAQQLRPRWKGKYAAPREVADALRTLNFRRTRAWNTPEQGFRTLWHWPETTTQGGE